MTPIRRNIIRRGIAEILDQCEPYLVPQETVFAQLNLTLRPIAALSEVEEVFRKMEIDRHTVTHRDNEGVLKAKLTDEGRVALLK